MRRFLHDSAANIGLLVAVCTPMLIGFVAIAVDVSVMYVDRRTAQTVTDLAALAASADPARATWLAQRTVDLNHIKLIAPIKVETGTYTADSALGPAQRFTASPVAHADAVRVTLRTDTPSYFARVIGAADKFEITTAATAAATRPATISIGARLATLDAAVLNQLLGTIFGGSIKLTNADYRAFADMHVSAFDLLAALAREARINGQTYGSILRADVRAASMMSALATALSKQGRVPSATIDKLQDLSKLAASDNTPVSFRSEINLGPYDGISIDTKPKATASVSVFQVIMATARLASGGLTFEADLPIQSSTVKGAAFAAVQGKRPASSVWNRTGPVGANVETPHTRLGLHFYLDAGAGLEVDLPLFVNVAHSETKLASVNCPKLASGTSATLAVKAGTAQVWIASIADSRWRSLQPVNEPPAANIASIGSRMVTASAHVAMAGGGWVDTPFSGREIDDKVLKPAGREILPLTESLLVDLRLGSDQKALNPAQISRIRNAIADSAQTIDGTVDTVAAFLGVDLGKVGVSVTDMRCEGTVLVN